MIDINELGTTYTLYDPNTGNAKQIQIVLLENFLELVGTYNESTFPYFQEYLEESVNYIAEGFVPTFAHVSWYARREGELDLVEAVKQAYVEQNHIVVIETLPETY